MYKIQKWRTILNNTAPQRVMLDQIGNVNKDSFSLKLLNEFNISITTKTLKLMVVACWDIIFENISHPISGNKDEHLWKLV